MATADKLNKLIETKQAIKTAISNKGVEVTDTDTFASYASKIDSIQTGGVDLGFEDIGYAYTPEYITKGLEVGKQIYDNFNPNAQSWNNVFAGVDPLDIVYIPKFQLTESDNLWSNTGSFIFVSPMRNLEIIPDFKFGTLQQQGRMLGLTNLKSVRLGGTLIITDSDFFNGCVNLREVKGTLNINKLGTLSNIFSGCESLSKIDELIFEGTPTGDATRAFYNVSNKYKDLYTIPNIDWSEIETLKSTFHYSGIKVLPHINSKKATTLYDTFYYSYIIKVTGLDLDLVNSIVTPLSGSTIRYMLLYNLGKAANLKAANLNCNYLGIEDETIPESIGALQALKDSLITNSFDRATAGYTTCTITLSSNTKALLTDDEIAQITAKGFTIA